MSEELKQRIRKIGAPPGTLLSTSSSLSKETRLSAFDFNVSSLMEKSDASLQECLALMNTSQTTWISICGMQDVRTVREIGEHFRLHPLLLEDIVNTAQRPKLDDYQNHLFIVMRALSYSAIHDKVENRQISLVLGDTYIISFEETEESFFEPLKARIRNNHSRIRSMGADYLAYAFMDLVVDHYFIILEILDEKLEKLEEDIIRRPDNSSPLRIERMKREISLLRKSIWPMRDVSSQFARLETSLIQSTTRVYISDIHDHAVQAIETIEAFRDISSGLLDIYLSNMSQRMNEVIKLLTIVTTIFAPLTFIAGLYGTNFDYIPELHWKWGFPFMLILMLATSLTMLWYFRKKNWL